MSAAAVRRLQEVAFENVPAMDDEGENEFVSEQVNEIVKNAITKTLGGSELYSSLFLSHVLKSELWTKQFALRPARSQYSKERVTSWTNQIIDECLKDIIESHSGHVFEFRAQRFSGNNQSCIGACRSLQS